MRQGDWIQTYTGKQFWPLDPRPEEVCIQDIAHALSLKCRYQGHTREFYSVAQHSVLVAGLVGTKNGCYAEALLHDAAEAYWPDIPRPIKISLPVLREFEDRIERAVAEAFDLIWPWPEAVKTADRVLLATEMRDLMAPAPEPWISLMGIEPFGGKIKAWDSERSAYEFEAAFARIPTVAPACPECAEIGDGMGPSHDGSKRCESGSIASGGKRAHCTCDVCF